MRILVTGRGKSGSWQVRGVQLGKAIGADVRTDGGDGQYDLAVIVKRPRFEVTTALRCPRIWDVVDAWPQPLGNEWTRDHCMNWLRPQVHDLGLVGIVAATEAMAEDCQIFGIPVLTLRHHARPGMRRNPLRERVAVVGYEGGEQYLGWWRAWLEQECARRGWGFVINPPALADVDIVVALRAAQGYAARRWKSNVKLANAQGSGTPSICECAAGYMETANAGQCWANDAFEAKLAFDILTDYDARKRQVEAYRAPTLENVAKTYREWLCALKS